MFSFSHTLVFVLFRIIAINRTTQFDHIVSSLFCYKTCMSSSASKSKRPAENNDLDVFKTASVSGFCLDWNPSPVLS